MEIYNIMYYHGFVFKYSTWEKLLAAHTVAKLHATVYNNTLDNSVLQTVWQHFGGKPSPVSTWHGQVRPDLNPIQHLRDELERRLWSRTSLPASVFGFLLRLFWLNGRKSLQTSSKIWWKAGRRRDKQSHRWCRYNRQWIEFMAAITTDIIIF